MSGDPCLKILGIPETATPTDLLGLPRGAVTVASVEAALLERIDVVFSHADARADEARHVRRILRGAAHTVLAGLRETQAPPRGWVNLRRRSRHGREQDTPRNRAAKNRQEPEEHGKLQR